MDWFRKFCRKLQAVSPYCGVKYGQIWSNFWQFFLTNSPCFGPRKTRRAVAAESAAVRSSNSCKSRASVASKIGSRIGNLPRKPTLWIAGYEIFHGRLQKNQLYSTTNQGLQRINDYVNEEKWWVTEWRLDQQCCESTIPGQAPHLGDTSPILSPTKWGPKKVSRFRNVYSFYPSNWWETPGSWQDRPKTMSQKERKEETTIFEHSAE